MKLDPAKDTDALIVGAGVVGLACGYALATAGLRVIVVEAGPRIGEGVSARNSEVIHAGLYYPCLLYTSPSPRDLSTSRMPSSA